MREQHSLSASHQTLQPSDLDMTHIKNLEKATVLAQMLQHDQPCHSMDNMDLLGRLQAVVWQEQVRPSLVEGTVQRTCSQK